MNHKVNTKEVKKLHEKKSNSVSKYAYISHYESCHNVSWELWFTLPFLSSSLWYCRLLHFGKDTLASRREWGKIKWNFLWSTSAQEQYICVLEPLLFYLGQHQKGKLLFKKQTLLRNIVFESNILYIHIFHTCVTI